LKRPLLFLLIAWLLALSLPREVLASFTNHFAAWPSCTAKMATSSLPENGCSEASISLDLSALGLESRNGLFCNDDPVGNFDPLGEDEFTLPDGSIDSSKVHTFGDFLHVMTLDFPPAVFHGLWGLPGQVNQGMAGARVQIDQKTNSGEYGPGAALLARSLEFMAAGSASLTMAPLQPVQTAKGIITSPYRLGSSIYDFAANPRPSGAYDIAENSLNLALLFDGATELQNQVPALQNIKTPFRAPPPFDISMPNAFNWGPGGSPIDMNSISFKRQAGLSWERDVVSGLKQTQPNVVPQITIRSLGPSGLPARLDAVGNRISTGATALTDAKLSALAPFTDNQSIVYPELEIFGGIVVGEGKPPFVGGTVIPPTKVDIIIPGVNP
jgi:hypothetical protein